jgi:hypothetical protein
VNCVAGIVDPGYAHSVPALYRPTWERALAARFVAEDNAFHFGFGSRSRRQRPGRNESDNLSEFSVGRFLKSKNFAFSAVQFFNGIRFGLSIPYVHPLLACDRIYSPLK